MLHRVYTACQHLPVGVAAAGAAAGAADGRPGAAADRAAAVAGRAAPAVAW
jgi:hypothetical protein